MILVAVVAREIVAGRNWRNLPMVAPVTVLGIANLLMHLEADGVADARWAWLASRTCRRDRADLGGRRADRAELHPELAGEASECRLSRPPPGLDRPGGARLLHAGLLGWAFLPRVPSDRPPPSAWRDAQPLAPVALARQRDGAEPLLFVLHIGYAWLVLGTALLGLAMLDADLPPSAAIHALTAGAIGTMILAVMTRVARGHTGRDLSADRVTSLIYILVTSRRSRASRPPSLRVGRCRF